MKEYKSYMVSENGDIFNKDGHKMHPYINHFGYLGIVLSGRKHESIHRLVGNLYVPNPENKKYINHKNGIKTDCRYSNLEWCTAKENRQHALKVLKVRTCKGISKTFKNGTGFKKLNNELILQIKLELSNGARNVDLAKKYNLNKMTICRINTNKIKTKT